jgi:hypothetical protein
VQRRFALIGHRHSLSDITDFGVTSVADNDVLQYNSATGKWENVTVAALNAQLDHGTLAGLGDDDHPQYPLAASTEVITGAWEFSNATLLVDNHIQNVTGYITTSRLEVVATSGDSGVWMQAQTAAADEQWVGFVQKGTTGLGYIQTANDAGSVNRNILAWDRTGAAVTTMAYGNLTDLPTHTFWSGASWLIEFTGTQGQQEVAVHGGDGYVGYTLISSAASGGASGYAWLEASSWGKTTAACTNASSLWLDHNRGSYATPAASQVGDELGEILFAGRGSTPANLGIPGTIRGIVESVGAAALGGGLAFYTHPGTGDKYTALVNRMQLMSNGEVRLGTDGYMRFDEHSSAPSTPATGNVAIYAKADGLMYSLDDAGVETLMSGGAGGGGGGGSGSAVPRYLEYFEDFIDNLFYTTTGTLWRYNTSGAGVFSVRTGDTGALGSVGLDTTTTNTSLARIYIASSTATPNDRIPIVIPTSSDATFHLEFRVKLSHTTATGTANMAFGLSDSPGGLTNGITADISSSGLRLRTCVASANTYTAASAAPATSTWAKVRFSGNTSEIRMYVDDVLVATKTGGIPTAAMTFDLVSYNGNQSVNYQLRVDYIRMWYEASGRAVTGSIGYPAALGFAGL